MEALSIHIITSLSQPDKRICSFNRASPPLQKGEDLALPFIKGGGCCFPLHQKGKDSVPSLQKGERLSSPLSKRGVRGDFHD